MHAITVRALLTYNVGMSWVYLDNNATTQPSPAVMAAVTRAQQELWANPSSMHRFGQQVRQGVELARASVAKLLHCKEREVLFTSGGTEANNLALRGVLSEVGAASNPVFITSVVEHSAIREPAQDLQNAGVQVVRLPVDRQGRVSVRELQAALEHHVAQPGAAPILVSLQWANNETGVIQPVQRIAEIIRTIAAGPLNATRRKILFHIDATQAVGKIPVDVRAVTCDLLTLAAHKFHGPKGIGALFVKQGVKLRPQNRGGPQERDRRGGTENTPGILGLGIAAEEAMQFLADPTKREQGRQLRDQLERGILASLSEYPIEVNSGAVAPEERLWNTTNLGFPRLEAEAILLGLSEQGVCASAGAACSSGSLEPSPVLLAMGIPEVIAHGSVRFSISRHTTAQEIERAIAIVPEVVRRLARTMPGGVVQQGV